MRIRKCMCNRWRNIIGINIRIRNHSRRIIHRRIRNIVRDRIRKVCRIGRYIIVIAHDRYQ